MRLELRNAEAFGVDGDNGRVGALEGDVKTMKAVMEDLKTFKTQALLLVAIAIPVCGFGAAMVARWLGH